MVYGFLISTNVLFWHFEAKAIHPTYSSNIKCAGMGLNGFIFRKINENENIKEKLKSWELFRSLEFWWKWAGLAVLFSRQLLNGSHDFFLFQYFNFHLFFQI